MLAAFALALLFMAVAVVYLCHTIDLALMEVASPALAAMGAAGAALVIAALAAVVGLALTRRSPRGAASVDRNRMAAGLGALLGGEATSFAAAHPKGTALGSLLTGFAVGADPALRRALRDLLL